MKNANFLLILLLLFCFSCQQEKSNQKYTASLSEIGAFKERKTETESFKYEEEKQIYHLKASDKEDLRLLWTPLIGDFILDVQLPETKGAGSYGLMLCSELETKVPIAALQIAEDKLTFMTAAQVNMGNAIEKEVRYIRFERKDKQIIAYYAEEGERFKPVASQRIEESTPVFGGLFARRTTQDLEFKNLMLVHPKQENSPPKDMLSRVEIYDFEEQTRRTILEKKQKIEAPNWHANEGYLVVNSEGSLYKIDLKNTNDWTKINTGNLNRCTSNHGIIDTNRLIFTHQDSIGARMYSLNLKGHDSPERLSTKAATFWQDHIKKEAALLYTATRQGRKAINIYRRPMENDKEVRLTKNRGMDFSADYSEVNDMIYLCSTRSGDMKIWQTSIVGLQRKQLTFDEYQDWSPTVSPDGKKLLFVSYLPEMERTENNQIQQILLRSLDLSKENARPKVIFHFYGDQSAISNFSCSPDGTQLAFVSYTFPTEKLAQEVKKEESRGI
ncbi:MAG: hypothetical protein AAF849_06950 [Bacteroidota bacterium]